MDIKSIFDRNKVWIKERLDEDVDFFETLAKGQNPELLYIGCSDSRVPAEAIIGARPGDVFVHRNIANMVPNTDLNVMSVIEYAVMHLEVNHVVVCGHYGCGGIKAGMQSADLGMLNPWLRNVRDVYRTHQNELESIADEPLRYRRLVELNVQEQTVNVLKTAVVQRAIKRRGLTVHGWVFDFATGEVVDLKIDFEAILGKISQVYNIED